MKEPSFTKNPVAKLSRLIVSRLIVVDEVKKSSGNLRAVPKPAKNLLILNDPAPNEELSNCDNAQPTVKAFGLLPPNQGSVKLKLYDLKNRLLDWRRNERR